MKKITSIIFLLFSLCSSKGQTPVGSWSDHLTYNTANCLAVGTGEVFASTGSSIIVYNKTYDEVKKMSRINGLSETGISTISWSEDDNTLVIAYSNANIDLVADNIIYNIPDIYRKYIPGKKEINRIRTYGRYAYLASSFGIVVVDLIKREINDTWKPGIDSDNPEVWDLTIGNGTIYAATDKGVYSADITNPGLAYYGNWSLIDYLPEPNGKYTSLVYSGNKLYINFSSPLSSGDSVFEVDGESTLFSFTPGVYNTSLDPAPSGFTISSTGAVSYYNNDGTLNRKITSYGWGSPAISHAVADNSDIWIADLTSGLVQGKTMSLFSSITLPGPVSNNSYNITSLNGRTIVCGGAADISWNNLWRPLQISIHQNSRWTTIMPGTIKDGMRALIDPLNNNHMFVSTWGGGLLEYENDVLVRQYTEVNSPLQNIIPGKPFVRICGLAMDKNNNLWITQSGVPGSIKVLKPNGTWIENPITIEALTIGDILITQRGHKWIILPRGGGLFILDDNNTPEIFTDDRSKKMFVEDSENKIISAVYSIAEDLDGVIWVGTDQGPFVYYNPEKVFENDIKAFRIKIPRNDGSGVFDYLLKNETITSIGIDGANRKWLGTSGSGAYLLSAEGTNQIRNYNMENSPLFSNSIVTLAVDNKSGDIWFGTAKGLLSVRGDASAGLTEFSGVYTFPNPVRQDFTGNVTITGLMRDSEIKITDVSGNLVYHTVSDGGQASWDLKTYNGQRVSTGVYLVFCASSDGSRSFVTKMLVIR